MKKLTWRLAIPPKTYIWPFNVAEHECLTWVVSPLLHWYGPYVKSKSASSCPKIYIKFRVMDAINHLILLTVERCDHWNIGWLISTQHKHCWFFSYSKCWKCHKTYLNNFIWKSFGLQTMDYRLKQSNYLVLILRVWGFCKI